MSARKEILENISEAQKSGARRKAACSMMGLSVRTVQRWVKDLRDDGRKSNVFATSNALTPEERKRVLDVACSRRFHDLSPNQIVPILAENNEYMASESTFYRLLKQAGLMTHRSKAKAPERQRPQEIRATAPNQVWSWDISFLLTLARGTYLYLYMIMDIWDRSIVGWAIHESELGDLAADLLRDTCLAQGVQPGRLTLHQDNGSPMVSGEFLATLTQWATASYSRPGVSDDNAFSESLFRTVKYRPGYPERFETIEQATEWIQTFVEWYNTEHRHSSIGFVTPLQRRNGEDFLILENRRSTYAAAQKAHPERWSGGIRKWARPENVTLNAKKITRQKEAA